MKRSLLLLLALPPLLALLARPAPRLDSDAVEYLSFVHSLYYDHDLDFTNEFAYFDILERGDKRDPTATGHRRTVFPVGTAMLWMPFYAAGDLIARASGGAEEGYSTIHVRAVTLANWLYAVVGLWLLHRVLVTVVAERDAAWALLLTLYATFLIWYLVYEPAVSHPVSFFMGALVLAVLWPARQALSLRRAVVLGLLIGLAADVRFQNGVLLLLPALALLPRLRSEPRASLLRGAVVLAAFALAYLPQALAWNAIYGSFVLADPPQGSDFLRPLHPFFPEVLLSSRHGLLYWTPVLWAGYLGLIAFLRRDPIGGLIVSVPLLVMTYFNACLGDWWGGGSFSNRRFDSVLPLLALGLAHAVAFARGFVARRPDLTLALGGALLVVWNALLMAQYRQGLLPADESVSFARVSENSAALFADAVGTPLAWPANWAFAVRHELPPRSYDRMVGKYLFYRQNNLGGVIDLGDDRADPALLGEGWSSRRNCEDVVCRRVLGVARLLAPLDQPETLTLVVRARGQGELRLAVNGVTLAGFVLGERLEEQRVRVPKERFRRELNAVSFALEPGGAAELDRISFVKEPGARLNR